MKIQVLFAIGLVTFLSTPQAQGDRHNCLEEDETGNCSCCNLGYGAPNCSVRCEHCQQRYVEGGKCVNFCEYGYYGSTCNFPCPTTCQVAKGSNVRPCKEEDSVPVCHNGCIPGYYGEKCSKHCNSNCQDKRCDIKNGKCLYCKSNHFYGDYCNNTCGEGCISEKCNKNGHCSDGCRDGIYGDQCKSQCGSNCFQKRCIISTTSTYICTEGCNDGYYGTNCSEKCSSHCKLCHQQNGSCTSCLENFLLSKETWTCETAYPFLIAETPRWIAPVIVSAVVMTCGIIVIIIVVFVRYRYVFCQRTSESVNDGSNSRYQSEEVLPQVCFVSKEKEYLVDSDDSGFTKRTSTELQDDSSLCYESDEEQKHVCLVTYEKEYNS